MLYHSTISVLSIARCALVQAGSWKIVIDGVELQDSDWKTLEAGQNYELGKGLPTSKYFPKAGEHKLSWRGRRVSQFYNQDQGSEPSVDGQLL
jgi:hypothetical protein